MLHNDLHNATETTDTLNCFLLDLCCGGHNFSDSADVICRNSDPCECVDANTLGLDDVGVCILDFLLPFEVSLT